MADGAILTMNTTDETIRAIARSEVKVEALTEAMRELKHAVEELVDRVDADIDTLRSKTEAFAVTTSNVDDLRQRVTVLETRVEAQGIAIAKLETKLETAVIERTKIETRLESMSLRLYTASGAAGALAWVAGKIWK